MDLPVIAYDQPFEVTRKQYDHLMENFKEIVAGQQSNGKFYIKVWLMRYADDVPKVLNNPLLK